MKKLLLEICCMILCVSCFACQKTPVGSETPTDTPSSSCPPEKALYKADSLDVFFQDLMLVNFEESETLDEGSTVRNACLTWQNDKQFPVPVFSLDDSLSVRVQCDEHEMRYTCVNADTGVTYWTAAVFRIPGKFEEGLVTYKANVTDPPGKGFAYNEYSQLWLIEYGDGKLIRLRFSDYYPEYLSALKAAIRFDLYEVTPNGVVKVGEITHADP